MTMWSTLTFSASFFTAAVFMHLLVCFLTGENRYILKGLVTGFIFFFLAAVWQYRAGASDLVALYLVLTLWLAYLTFFANLLNSITLKMLARLAEEPAGAMEEAGFRDIFNEETAIKARLEDMLTNAFLERKGENLALTAKAGLLLKSTDLIRKVFSIDDAG